MAAVAAPERPPHKLHAERSGGDAMDKCPRCNLDLSGDPTRRARGFLHVIIAIACDNWPESHRFQPDSASHLRAWLFCHPKVAHCDRVDALPHREADALTAADFMEKLLERIRERGGYAFVATEIGALTLLLPRSSANPGKGGPHKAAFYALLTRILAAIEDETGMSRVDLRREGIVSIAPNRRFGGRAS